MDANTFTYTALEQRVGEQGAVLLAGAGALSSLYAGLYIAHRYLPSSLDRLGEKWNRDTVGAKSLMLALLLGCFSFFELAAVDKLSEKVFKSVVDGSGFVCISLIAGLSIVCKKQRERNVKECMQQCLFFLSGSMFTIPWMHANRHMRLCGVFLLSMYGCHVLALSPKGKVPEAPPARLPSFAGSRRATRGVDFLLGAKEGLQTSSALSLFVSSLLLCLAGHQVFLPLSLYALALLGAAALGITAALTIGSKAGATRRTFYLLAAAISWLKLLAGFFKLSLAYLVQDKAQLMLEDKGGLLEIAKMCFPVLCVAAGLVRQNRYRISMIFVLNSVLHYTLYTNGILYLTKETSAETYTEYSRQSAIFLMISTLVLFLNNEMRSGMLETEIGCILIFLFFVFIFYYIYFVTEYSFR